MPSTERSHIFEKYFDTENNISMYLINGSCLISTSNSYFLLFYRQKALEKPHIAASHTSFLRSYFKNMNLEALYQIVFLDEKWGYANGTEFKMWSDVSSQSL
jgi:hypothetical protein